MRFAIIDNKSTEAAPGLKGLCPGCSQPVIAKCGNQRIHHWAHVSNKTCDSWWEPETEWHRAWKNHFPVEWQEVFLPDPRTGEKHVADVRTSRGLILEFQHSKLSSQERNSREKFYGNMAWIVDGTRLKKDFTRFLEVSKNLKIVSSIFPKNLLTQNPEVEQRLRGYFFVNSPEKYFPMDWLNSSVPVIFDFRSNNAEAGLQDAMRDNLWCLMPGRIDGHAVLVGILRSSFVTAAKNNPILPIVTVNNIAQLIQQARQPQQYLVMPRVGYNTSRRGPLIDELQKQKRYFQSKRQWRGKRRF